jgi:hypothetical protein
MCGKDSGRNSLLAFKSKIEVPLVALRPS